MSYREPLPEDCPPNEAEEIMTARVAFRLVRTKPATQDDFSSQRAEKPEAVFQVTECQARGLSVFTERSGAENALKLPKLKGRFICCVRLGTGAGCIQQTGRPPHHTWWPLAEFDILAHCQMEAV